MAVIDEPCRIAAVVPTFNRRDLLEHCLTALLLQTRPLDEIMIVDNASTEGTTEMLRAKFPHNVTLVAMRENAGSAGGFREGIWKAYEKGHDWIWVMDNDAEPFPEALEELIESPYFHDTQVGLLSSMVVSRDGKIEASHHLRLTACMKEVPATGEAYDSDIPLRLDAKSYTGSLVRRAVVERIGFPSEDFFAYQDDLDYTYRIGQRFKMFQIPSSRVIHADGKIAVRRGVLRRSFDRTRFDKRWKTYYLVRNNTFFVTRRTRAWILPLVLAKTLLSVARRITGVFVFDDHKSERTALVLSAWRDGLLGRLGKVTDLRGSNTDAFGG